MAIEERAIKVDNSYRTVVEEGAAMITACLALEKREPSVEEMTAAAICQTGLSHQDRSTACQYDSCECLLGPDLDLRVDALDEAYFDDLRVDALDEAYFDDESPLIVVVDDDDDKVPHPFNPSSSEEVVVAVVAAAEEEEKDLLAETFTIPRGMTV